MRNISIYLYRKDTTFAAKYDNRETIQLLGGRREDEGRRKKVREVKRRRKKRKRVLTQDNEEWTTVANRKKQKILTQTTSPSAQKISRVLQEPRNREGKRKKKTAGRDAIISSARAPFSSNLLPGSRTPTLRV